MEPRWRVCRFGDWMKINNKMSYLFDKIYILKDLVNKEQIQIKKITGDNSMSRSQSKLLFSIGDSDILEEE